MRIAYANFVDKRVNQCFMSCGDAEWLKMYGLGVGFACRNAQGLKETFCNYLKN